MADSGSFYTGGYNGRVFEFSWWITSTDVNANIVYIGWALTARGGSAQWYNTQYVRVSINGNQVYAAPSGKTPCYVDRVFASDSYSLSGGSTFSAEVNGDIHTYGGNNAYGYGSWTLPVLIPPSVSPTLPNSVVANGSNGMWWLDKDSPLFNISWSGASNGTYVIDQYSVDATKRSDWNGAVNVSLYNTWGGTYGDQTNLSLSSLGLSGGETVWLRVGMRTSNGTWWGHTYWGGSFHIYSKPSAPTINVPTTQEIDTAFNVSWSGAVAGSEGIATYQLQRRIWNGSTWTDWVTIQDKNTTSCSQSSPKTIVGSANGAAQIDYRVRAFDGKYGYSNWSQKTLYVQIYAPTTPRKFERIII